MSTQVLETTRFVDTINVLNRVTLLKFINSTGKLARVNSGRGECLTQYRAITNDSARFKGLL